MVSTIAKQYEYYIDWSDSMAKALSRKQKQIANEMQKKMLQPIISYNKLEKLVGSELADNISLVDLLSDMSKLGISSTKEKVIDELSYFALLSAMTYISLEKLRSEQAPQKEEDTPQLDTSKLYIGQVFKNYNELCKFLNIEIKTGKSKQLQEQHFRCYFDYEKLSNSNEIIILDVYSEPILSNKNPKYRNSKYVNQLKILILYELLLCEPDSNGNVFVCTTYSKLVKQLKLINAYYYNDTSDFFVSRFQEKFPDGNIQPQSVRKKITKFKGICKQTLYDSITYALHQLQKDHLIIVDKYHVIVQDGVHRKATQNEEIEIQTILKKASNQLGYKNSFYAEIYKPEEFKQLCDSLYRQNGWSYVYYRLEIGTRKEFLCKHLHEFTAYPDDTTIQQLNSYDVRQYCLDFNNNLCSYLEEKSKEQAETEIRKQIDYLKESDSDLEDWNDEAIIIFFGLNKINDQVAETKEFIEFLIRDDAEHNTELSEYYGE